MTNKFLNLPVHLLVAGLVLGFAFDAIAQRGGGRGGGFGGGLGGGFGGGGGARGGTTTSASQYPAPGQIGEALITSYPDTKQIVVITDQVTAEQMRTVVQSLDRPVPQVLIKVVFLEVTYRDGLDIGLEGGITKMRGDTTINATNAFGLIQQGIAPLLPYASLPGAGIYSIMGTDYMATLRAIAEAGKLEVLSRPSILARNNQLATITVGQDVPLITGVTYDAFGQQRNEIDYQSVGIILNVTPFISSDGMVEMIVQPEISALSGQTIPVSTGDQGTVGAPIIDRRSADTVVVTPDGQTVVIGGLIQNRKDSTNSKVPILGDIPLLGNLFKRRVKQDVKTELMIFLTPHIINQPSQLAAVTQSERDNAKLTRKAFSEDDLQQFLNDVPTKEEDPQVYEEGSGGRGRPSGRR